MLCYGYSLLVLRSVSLKDGTDVAMQIQLSFSEQHVSLSMWARTDGTANSNGKVVIVQKAVATYITAPRAVPRPQMNGPATPCHRVKLHPGSLMLS